MNPIQIPQEWSDNGLITFEEFCDLIRTPQRTVRDWRQGASVRDGHGSTAAAASTSPSPKPAGSSAPRRLHDTRSGSMAEKTLPVYLSLEEAAEVMSLSVKTIRRRIADGTIPAYQCGRRPIRIRLDELEAALRPIPSARW